MVKMYLVPVEFAKRPIATRIGSYDLFHTHGGSKFKSIEQLVLVSYTYYYASTPSLSTWWSSTALKGDLVSRGASRLDAFSGYPVRI